MRKKSDLNESKRVIEMMESSSEKTEINEATIEKKIEDFKMYIRTMRHTLEQIDLLAFDYLSVKELNTANVIELAARRNNVLLALKQVNTLAVDLSKSGTSFCNEVSSQIKTRGK